MTRLKRRIKFKVLEPRPVDRAQGLTSDQTIVFTSARGRTRCPHPLRRIGYRDPGTGRHYVFPATNFRLSAKTVADIYQSRWQVELFFKWIKQHLKVKSFVGTSRNAVMTQLWIAMCVHLLLSYIKFANRLAWSLNEILRCAPAQPVRPAADPRRARTDIRSADRLPGATSADVRVKLWDSNDPV